MNNEVLILSLLESMKGQLEAMNGDMEAMKGDMVTMKGDMVTMKGDMVTMKGQMVTMNGRLDKVETELAFVKNTVTRIENEHGNKLDALFDGYHQLKGITERIEAHVSAQDDDILKRVFPSAMVR
ncbi:hypothetical protein FACS1894184_19680 [Clostridia bacterium]|nr:hypothetical protein FACS1894184_19680 [Clostridia bacterium]